MSDPTAATARGWWTSPPPSAAVEITAGHVAAVSVERGREGVIVRAYAAAPLPPGALVPALNASNLVDREAVVAAVRAVLEQVGRPRRVGLVVPDPAAKVSLVRFETVPARGEDLLNLVRWQVRKSAPFPIDTAQVALTPGARLDGGAREFVVTVMRRDLVEEYEQACAQVGAEAGLVDVSTFNVVNLALASGGPPGDWLVVHLTSAYSTLAIVRDGALLFFRSRLADGEGDLPDLVHQTAMYYEDRLSGQGFSQVVVAGGTDARERAVLLSTLEERLGRPVAPLDARRIARFADRIDVGPEVLDGVAAPLGLVLRES
ncbi:MAG: pilus assembly protein PilM [Acidobacteria bacterium]|nr:pilus assembly protein PilM [Acidobacteriota bacterium]